MMNYSITAMLVLVVLAGCQHRSKIPDVSKYPVVLEIHRFDQVFFSLDTNNLSRGLDQLNADYADFFPQYLTAILGINPADPLAPDAIKAFLRTYKIVYQEANKHAGRHLPQLQRDLRLSLQLMQHYFPGFKPDSPFVVTTFIGPMDAYEPFSVGDYGDVRTVDGVGIAMQLHLGADNPQYDEGINSGVFYDYQVRRFIPETMVVNGIKNLLDDLYPYRATGRPLVEEMVEKGKRMYVLSKVLPHVHDTLQIGYTGKQWNGSLDNEPLIWQFFVKNDLLYSVEPSMNMQYLKDGPKTPELGDASPGYVGLFVGWRIVDAYMQKNPATTPEALMALPANELFQASGYKPR